MIFWKEYMINERIFIDTNILLYLFEQPSKFQDLSEKILQSLSTFNQIGIINSYVINEFHYNIIKAQRTKNIESSIEKALTLPNIEYKDIKFTQNDILEIAKISNTYNLKTFDAYHAYYCKKEKIKQIATFDSDFKNTPWLKIYQSSLDERNV